MNELQVYQFLFGVTFVCNLGLTIYAWRLNKRLKQTEFALGISWALR